MRVAMTLVLLFMFASVALAQEVTVYGLFRTGINADGNGLTYNLAEIDLQKGRVWAIAAWIGFPNGQTAEVYGGAGYDFISRDKFYLHGEMLIDKQVGADTRGALFVLPVLLTGGKLSEKMKWQIFTFPYLSADSRGLFQFVLERAQVWRETAVGNIGGGIGLYCAEHVVCQLKPFVSYAPPILGRKVQLWYQHNARTGQQQIQIRFYGKLWSR